MSGKGGVVVQVAQKGVGVRVSPSALCFWNGCVFALGRLRGRAAAYHPLLEMCLIFVCGKPDVAAEELRL